METQSAFMAAAAAFVLLVATLARRRDPTALGFCALVLAFGAWSYGRGGHGPGLPLAAEIEALALTVLGPAALLFSAQLVGRLDLWRRSAPGLLLAATALALASLLRGPDAPFLARIEVAWAALGVLGGSLLLWRERTATATREIETPEATRLRYLALCGVLIPITFGLDLAAWAAGLPRIATPFAALLYLYASYLHLARVRLVDLRQLTTSAAALVVLAACVAGLFGTLWVRVGGRMDLFLFDAFVASLVLLMALPQLRSGLQRAIERRLLRSKVELERLMEPLGERLGHILTLDELLREFLATLERADRVTASSVYLRDDPRVGFQQAASIGLPPRPRVNLIRDPAFVAALEADEILLEEDLDPEAIESRPGADPERARALRAAMRQLDARLVLPLRTPRQLVGFWSFSNSMSDQAFSAAEIALLRSVADRAASCIENSKTFEQIRARERFTSLGEMAAGLAHEIRNPLASIKGALSVLPSPEAPELRELHEVILEETERLDRVVGTFLNYTQPTLHAAKVEQPGAFVRDCVEGIERRSGATGIRLQIETEPGLPAIAADPDQLESVLVNVVRNAYEALLAGRGSADGTIRVHVGAVRPVEGKGEAEGVEVSIEDDGPGMAPETLERAFVPFFTTKDRGTGLGLPLCERLVRSRGGALELRSELDVGTRVTLRFPACGDAETEAA
jgi:signal transduction histidine kinase